MVKIFLTSIGIAVWVFAACLQAATLTDIDASLTPYGAEQKGNKDKSIPPWEGGLVLPASSGKVERLDNPFAEEKPLFTIQSSNIEQYRKGLSDGLIALLETYPDSFFIPVYPSHRTANAPGWVYENIAKNDATAMLVNDGNGIKNAFGGIPFPRPVNKDGSVNPHKILWNHLTRWRGVYVEAESTEAPVTASGSYSLVTSQQQVNFLYYDKNYTFETLDNKLAYFLASIKKPSRLAGGALLVHETIDRVEEPREAWVYAAGQRRVRKAPTVAYDTPVASSDDLLAADDVDMFNGALDRFEWRYVGKEERYIPYNNFVLSQRSHEYENLLHKGHINPELTRFERHRVWIVEGTLKKGVRHIYSKRTFYIDEDSWNIVQADQYDSRGILWRVHLSYLVDYYHVPVTWSALSASYDVQSNRYYAGFLDNSNGFAIEFIPESPPAATFSPQALRRMGTR